MTLLQMIEMLSDAKVDYVVVGGLAVALHGYQRVTMDVDVVLAMTPDNLRAFINSCKAYGLQPVIPVDIDSLADPRLLEQWFQEKGMLAFGLRGPETTSTVIDVLIKPRVSFTDLKRDATIIGVGNLNIPIASIDHLIAMKTDTGRSKDALDIEELKKLQEGPST
ncbi:DUF6036 family nucleotidyltransferase [Sulfurivermis fontis]|jgi:hypothetical protein|uniref:DUF6036 family nucleotidyltransferase n=1 Tax=Sulfurivermis fontis TaxID=1972068 RepID=UPI000FD8C2BB|nr:DUF6036 family nucleotidyltransferase [Sulfurivermis fontis]